MAKSNNADVFRIPHTMLLVTGMWPKKNEGILYRFKAILSWAFLISINVTMFLTLINDINNLVKVSEILYIMMTIATGMIKLAVFMYKRKVVLEMLNFLDDPIFVSYPDDMDHHMKKTIRLSGLVANFYRGLCFSSVVLFSLYPLLDDKPLPFPFPYDPGNYRFIVYILQLIAGSVSPWTNGSIDSLTANLMALGAAQLDILMDKLIQSFDSLGSDEEGEQVICKKLQQCVEHHLAIMKFIGSVETIFSIGLLAQFLASIMVICNTLFHFVLIPINSIQVFCLCIYFSIMITQLTMYCYFGNEIMFKSEQIGEACYCSKWYSCGNKVAKYLLIIVERSKSPLGVSVMKISKLTLTAYVAILQWSYSYLTLLLNLYQNSAEK